MYRKKREKHKKIIQNVIWLLPLILVIFMFLLGACTRATISPTYTSTVAAENTSAGIQSDKANPSEDAARLTADIQTTDADSGTETTAGSSQTDITGAAELSVEEGQNYTSRDEVALYLHRFGKLPPNFITKKDAEDKGWNSSKGDLWEVLPGKSIGGSLFGNYEDILPKAENRRYYECDIDYAGGYRNSKRIVWSNDGLIFYTEDHYNTFTQLY